MTYNVDYFIAKFEAIPEERWCVGLLHGPNDSHCALGHCGFGTDYEEGGFLIGVLSKIGTVSGINNGHDIDFRQPTPKQRILAALRQVKEKAAV